MKLYHMDFFEIKRKAKQGFLLFQRNQYTTHGNRIKARQVNLEWVSNGNLGDELAPTIYSWMLKRRGIEQGTTTARSIHLMTVGSMIGAWNFDAVVWGSGIHLFDNLNKLYLLKGIQKFDVRAVRGPITRKALKASGHKCPEIYGDPAVLMPLIYTPDKRNKKYKNTIVLHYRADREWKERLQQYHELHCLEIGTKDYEYYINEMVSSEKIISSSLHGIILAETYGIPSVFLNTGEYVDEALMKYYDWYFSTGRYSVKMARTIEEAVQMEPMTLPNLESMQKKLLNSFPYDLWE